MSEHTHCYVGVAECGCAVAATVDVARAERSEARCEDMRRHIMEFLRDGLVIERKLVEWVREPGNFGHKCGKGCDE